MARALGRSFYRRKTEIVARELLGCTLVRILPGGQRLSGRIVETEAYLGVKDRAAHTFGGRRSERNEVMYLHGGYAYVYFIYGMYYCLNVVTREAGVPEAVLIRAIEPIEGLAQMRRRRPRIRPGRDHELCNGPGKLCLALGIDRKCNGILLNGPPLFIERGKLHANEEISVSARIGVDYAGAAAGWPLRFFVKSHRGVSQPR